MSHKRLPSMVSVINVAVAVIHYQDQYLLGFRNQNQHQGNRYEFVGGKIEAEETAEQALIREVHEEIGIDISDNIAIKLGRLHHDYGDKKVCLHVYQITLTSSQFKTHQHLSCGLEGQAVLWVLKSQLLAGHYPLPAANGTILAWLKLPSSLAITYPLAYFSDQPLAADAWLAYHRQHLPSDMWVYLRVKASETSITDKSLEAQLSCQLITSRPDINYVLPYQNMNPLLTMINPQECVIHNPDKHYIKACHLTHNELMQWFAQFANNPTAKQKEHQDFNSEQALLISCHDADSIHAANQLAAIRLEYNQAPVIGIFLSPVLETKSHPDETPLGWSAWGTLAQRADMPVIALGGLLPAMLQQARQYGAASIAGIRAFLTD